MTEYCKLVNIIDQSKRKSADDEAMRLVCHWSCFHLSTFLVINIASDKCTYYLLFQTTLKALSEAVSKIDIMYHHSLLNTVCLIEYSLLEVHLVCSVTWILLKHLLQIFTISIWYLQRHTMDVFLDLITRLVFFSLHLQ
jgi:hypothetical protein